MGNIVSTAKSTITVTPEQVAFFQREGYLAIPAITTQEEIAWMREIYDRLFKSRAGRETGDQFDLAGADEDGKEAALPQILGPVKYAPELANTLYRANALAISRQLLGPATKPGGEHAIFKPAGIGAATPWHQDEAYWDPNYESCALSVWMPLQEATVENGCLHFVPGSHRLDVLPHHCINNDPRVHGLEVDNPESHTRGAVACPLPPGGATFHYGRTLHYAGPNLSGTPRRAYILGFSSTGKKRATPRLNYWNEQKTTPRQERARATRQPETKVKATSAG